MQHTVDIFRNHTNNLHGKALLQRRLRRPRPRMVNTIVIIPYSSTPGSQRLDAEQQELVRFTHKLRLLYLQACVYSVSRYFPKIIVATVNDDDLRAVDSLSLPLWKLINLQDMVQGITKKLPQMSLIYVYEQLMNNTDLDWKSARYVYYTEMDQLLQIRVLSLLYSLLDSSHHHLIMVPHRLNV
jgi:hypothetical protein